MNAEPVSAPPDRDVAAWLLPIVAVGSFIALWELAPRVGWVRYQSIPPFSTVIVEVGAVLSDDRFLSEVQASATRWLMGVVLAVALGVPLGLLMGRYRAVFLSIDPLLTVTYPVPKAALILPLVLIFGAGNASRVTIIVIGSLLPIVTASYHGARAIDPRLLWSARAFGTSRLQSLRKIVLPAALPSILSGLRMAIAISIFILLASELLIRQSGVGAYLFRDLDNGRFERVWATSVIWASTGFILDMLYVRVVRVLVPWLEGEV